MTIVLTKPVVAVQNDTRVAETIPRGASVVVSSNSPSCWAEISWNGLWYSVFREDILDACSVGDLWQVNLATGHRGSRLPVAVER